MRALRRPLPLLAAFLLLASSYPGVSTARVAASPQPIVSVAVNGEGDVSLFQGWPLLVQVTLVNPQPFDTSNPASPITISGGDGPWSNTVRLHVVDSTGTEQAWPVQISTQTANAIALGANNRGVLEYYVNPSDTARLAAGSYQIWADVAGYQVNSAATTIAVAAEPDTLSDALYKAIHSLQDDFPVVRGPNLVGVVSRQGIVQALRQEGNGYVQGIMSRAFQVAQPDDSLGVLIRRIGSGRLSLFCD